MTEATYHSTAKFFVEKTSGNYILRACLLSPFSCVRLFVTLWTVAHQDPWSMGFSRWEYWSGSPYPPPGHLPNLGIEPTTLLSPASANFFFFFFFITSTIWEAQVHPKLQSTKWSHSVVSDSVIPWTVAHQAPPPMEFSRQEYWSVLSLPSPGDLPNPGIEHRSSALRVEALPSEPPGKQKYILDGVKPLVTPVWP